MQIPELTRQHIVRGIAYGVILLFWLSTEDHTLWFASLLGTGLAAMLIWLSMLRWFGGKQLPFMGFIVIGGLIGFGGVWGTQFLMIFKNAWHAHAFLDFPTSIVIGMSRRLLPWALAGGLIGAAVGLWRASAYP